MASLSMAMQRLAEEPPFRVIARAVIKRLASSVRTKAHWDTAARPQYLTGILGAADEAKREGIPEISVMEFGVAGGSGLVLMQEYAADVEAETGIRIAVYGFDAGSGLPELCGDFRDHPDQWSAGDYWMDEALLRSKLTGRSQLVLGDVRVTVPRFVSEGKAPPTGFVSIDVDLYSSTVAALKILTLPGKRTLRRVPMYFDDVEFTFNHRFAGELLAIEEFNQSQAGMRIDVWRGLAKHRPFPDSPWLRNMYMAHDIEAISAVRSNRTPAPLPLSRDN